MTEKKKSNAKEEKKVEERGVARVNIAPPNIQVTTFKLVGTAPYVQCRFSKKARDEMKKTQERGSTAKKGEKKKPRDFDADYKDAFHVSDEGWYGIPCAAIRAAMVRACKLAGFNMTDAKVTLFVELQGLDADDKSPLVQIYGDPKPWESHVRLATGVANIAIRPMWETWEATVQIKFDADVFTLGDVANVLNRAGAFVGIGEGRPDSKKSCGLGFGLFRILDKEAS
jgi:hypothetical protein